MNPKHSSVLFAGCSLTCNSGFTDKNLKFHWPVLFSKKYCFDVKNIAIGGMSNNEIFYRSIETTLESKPDIAIVMWSQINRRWEYYSDNNVDDFTIMNSSCDAYNSHLDEVQQFAKLSQVYFVNTYVNIKKWFCYSIALANYFKNNDIDYIFLRGFDNHIDELYSIFQKPDENLDITRSSDQIKRMFDFTNRPDDYIIKKVQELKTLYKTTSKLNWANLLSPSFHDMTCDFADDLSHPGRLSNEKIYAILNDYYETIYA